MLQYALNMKKFLLTAGVLLGACKESGPKLDPIKLVPKVDLNRYMGTWYVIANIPNFFEKGLVASTETYTRNSETGKIDILFQGRKNTFDGEIKKIPQTAQVLDENIGSEWKVRIFFWLRVPYLIQDLDPNYQWVVVGYPDRSLIWIMSRAPKMDDALYTQILERVKIQGYDLSKIVKVPQP